MVRKPHYRLEADRRAHRDAQRDKKEFSLRATEHILRHEDESIPPLSLEHPTHVIRLWLERFPDVAAMSLGTVATGLVLRVEDPHADPLIVHIDRESK